MTRLSRFCLAIQAFEGYEPGSKSWRNKNAGNVRWTRQANAIKTADNFACFLTYEDGFEYLMKMVKNAASGRSKVYRPEMTITEFFRKYAPVGDGGNNPERYAQAVALWVGLKVTDPISKLLM